MLQQLHGRNREYPSSDVWTKDALDALPVQLRAIAADDEEGAIAFLLLTPGFLEAWGAPTDLLGGNPIVPHDEDAARIHAALLAEASAWIDEENLAGLEVLLPMSSENVRRDDVQDAFYEGLGFQRFYYTMVRELDAIDECPSADFDIEVVPAAALQLEDLYSNYSACTAAGEIELVAHQTPNERRAYFDDLASDTLGHPGSLALMIGDEMIGFALVAPVSETAAHLAWIGIAPNRRGEGLGQLLLCQVMQTCKEHQVERMSLYTDATVEGRTLYEAFGFARAGTLTYRWRRSSEGESR